MINRENGTDALLKIEALSKNYNGFLAVDDLNLSVSTGEIFGFLGPNGAGKTTTIKMITGLLKPTDGTIHIAGKNNSDEPAYCKEKTGYIPDRPYLYDKLTGAEYLAFVASLYQENKTHEPLNKAQQYLELFDLVEWQNHLIEGYSHGMKQKLIMTSIFMLDQPIIVVDEPMVGLDPKSAKIVKELFKSKARSGTAIFLSTHSMEIAEELCDRIGIINKGQLIAIGTLEELKQNSSDDKLEELFLSLTGAFELQNIVAALRKEQ